MPHIEPILKNFESGILYRKIDLPYLASESSIHLAQNRVTAFRDIIIIGSLQDVLICLKRGAQREALTVILTNCPSMPDDITMFYHADNLVVTSRPNLLVYTMFLQAFHQYHTWKSRLVRSFTYTDSHTILPPLSRLLSCASFVYSAEEFYQMDSCISFFNNKITEELKTQPLLPSRLQTVPDIRTHTDTPTIIKDEHGYSYVFKYMTDSNNYSILLMLIYDVPLTDDFPMADFLFIVSGLWEQHLNFAQCFQPDMQPSLCDRLLTNLYENTFTETYQISEHLQHLPYKVEEYIAFLYIQFKKESLFPLRCKILKKELCRIFPEVNIGFLGSAIVVIASHASNQPLNNFHNSVFIKWLDDNYAYAGMSNGTRYYENLHTILLMSKKICNLGIEVSQSKNTQERYFNFNQLHTLFLIDLCHKSFADLFGQDNLVYLTNPAILALIQYDRVHGTNLKEVLYCYLLNNCNVIKTAGLLFVHRNTVQNRINMILQMTNLNLDDPYLRLSLIMSCQIIDYYENTLHHYLDL